MRPEKRYFLCIAISKDDSYGIVKTLAAAHCSAIMAFTCFRQPWPFSLKHARLDAKSSTRLDVHITQRRRGGDCTTCPSSPTRTISNNMALVACSPPEATIWPGRSTKAI